MLLIITNKSDLASDYLILRLNEVGIPFLRFNTEELGRGAILDINITAKTADFSLVIEEKGALDRSSVSGVYFRQPVAPEPEADVQPSDREFAKRELRESLRSLWRLIEPEKWLNHPRHLWLASNKIEQLSVALSLGFEVPDTCVTTSEALVRDFYDRHNGKIIAKAVKHGFYRRGSSVTVAPTQRVDRDFLERFAGFAALPTIYQREIPKAFDVRVIVLDGNVFATAIHSQEHPETTVDWRVWDFEKLEMKHERIKLPCQIETLCKEITRRYNLRFSAIDLVLTPSGTWYFLEMNPNGQWAWIEAKVGYPIRDTIIHCLSYGSETA